MTEAPDEKIPRLPLASVTFGNFLVGTAILAPAGMIAELSDAFAVSLSAAGSLLWVGSITVAVGAPFLAWATARLDRRLVLTGAMAALALGYLLGLVAPDFGYLVAARVLVGIGAGLFTPQAAAVVGLLVPGRRRTQAVAFVMLGWSLAAALGFPLAKLLAAHFGWQSAMASIGLAATACALSVWLTVRPGIEGTSAALRAWGLIARHGLMLATLGVTLIMMVSQYLVLTYMVPVIDHGLGADESMVAVLLALFGAAGVAGSAIVTRYSAWLGGGRGVLLGLGVMTLGHALWWAFPASGVLVTAAIMLWGLGNFATNALQQGRLIALDPALASASVALNSSMIYLGGAIGSYLGGLVLEADAGLVPLAGAAIMGAALLLAVPLARR